jgi:enamine deaminase RidA (YjgF/YER057c/UK114 family)
MTMTSLTLHNPAELYPPHPNYSHAVEAPPGARLLYIAGINGYDDDGQVPDSFEAQADLTWRHIGTLLTKAGMTYTDLVSVRTYIAHPDYHLANHAARAKALGDHRPALTVICCQMVRSEWKIEIDAVAAKAP